MRRCALAVLPVLLAPAMLIVGMGHVPSAPRVLPAAATTRLADSLAAAQGHARHVWRDTPPRNADGTVNAYVEIERGDRRKWEFDMRAHARVIDRILPETVGGYPVNYGFVPQTVSYDGDPLDVLVLGPPIAGGRLVRGVAVGLLFMDDEKGPDAKVVVAPVDGADGTPRTLTPSDRQRIGRYFSRYKALDANGYSSVQGWGSIADGHGYVAIAHAFFLQCRAQAGRRCHAP